MAAWLSAVVGAVALAVGVGCTLARSIDVVPGVAGDTWAMVTTFTDFGLLAYALALIALLTSVLVWRRSRVKLVLLAVTLVLTVVHGSWLVPEFVADRDPIASPTHVRVLTQNLLFGEADPSSLRQAAADADVVVLVELTQPTADALGAIGFDQDFPYAGGGRLPDTGPSGTRIYSRYPLTESRRLDHWGGQQNWRVSVMVPGMGPITVVALHPPRPRWGGDAWLPVQQRVLRLLPTTRTVVAGDLNAVGSHPSLRRYADRGFREADDLAGAGWQPTFPAQGPVPPLIAIDHILVSAELTVTDFRTVAVTGSDHRGVLASVHLRAA